MTSFFIYIIFIFLALYFVQKANSKKKQNKGNKPESTNNDQYSPDPKKTFITIKNKDIEEGYMNLNGVHVRIKDADKLNF